MKIPVFLIPSILIFLGGCGALQFQIKMPDNADPASFVKYDVKEIPVATEPVNRASFGPYEVTLERSGIKKSINRSDSFGTDEYKNSASENYRYDLKVSGKAEWTGECGSSADYFSRESGFLFSRVIQYNYRNSFTCSFTSKDRAPVDLRIEVDDTNREEGMPGFKKGIVSSGAIKLDIERTMDTENLSLLPMNIGYYIYHNGRPVAVIQNVINGAVYIHSSIEPEVLPLVVNASAAILTYYDLENEVLPSD